MQVDQKYRTLLGKVGFMASRWCRYDDARAIFTGLNQTDPSKAGPYVGLATILMSEGKAAEAISLLKDKAMAAVPEDADVKAYLGLAYFMNKQHAEAKEVLTPVAASGDAGSAASLAKSLLAQIG
jgi:cytochrome c-type biogenesis protein CcmH/NrfG